MAAGQRIPGAHLQLLRLRRLPDLPAAPRSRGDPLALALEGADRRPRRPLRRSDDARVLPASGHRRPALAGTAGPEVPGGPGLLVPERAADARAGEPARVGEGLSAAGLAR